MPFRSLAQRRWMYANDPKMAKEWEQHTSKDAKLPEKVKKSSISLDTFKSFVQEVVKLAASDVLTGAGVGSETDPFTRGIASTNISDSEAKKRRAQIAIGGFLAGSLIIPPMYSALHGIAANLTKGPLAALKGAVREAPRPFMDVMGGFKKPFLNGVTSKDVKQLSSLVSSPGFQELINNTSEAAAETLKKNPHLRDQILREQKASGITGAVEMGLSGLLGAAGAYSEFDRGQNFGKKLTPIQRKQLVKESMAGPISPLIQMLIRQSSPAKAAKKIVSKMKEELRQDFLEPDRSY